MTGIFVNFFECYFQKDHFVLHALDYADYDTKEKYKELKNTHKRLSFMRNADKIYYWELEEKVEHDLDGEAVTINSTESPYILLRILESALINRLDKTKAYRIFLDKHSHVWKIVSEKDLLNSSIEGLALYQQICLNTFYRRINKEISFGIIISTEIEHRFTWGKKEFDNHGIDTSNLKGKDNVIFANPHALKIFLAARGKEVNYKDCINQRDSNERKMAVISGFFSWVDKCKTEFYLPDNNQLTSITKKYLEYSGITREVLQPPKRLYFGGHPNEQAGLRYNEQVKKYKPYSFELFDNNPVKIGVLCPQQFEGTIEGFISKLENILRNDLHLRKVEFHSCYTKDANRASYQDKLYDPELLNCSVIIIVVTEEHKSLPSKGSPYFLCKAKYIGNGIPTQDVRVKNIKNSNPFILNNIALNIYAKLGGTAWTIEKEEKRKEELVIGIGSTIDQVGKQVMGIAQVFNADGRYLVGECTPLSNFDNYAENLRAYLERTLNELISNHINRNQEFRLIFHLFKSASSKYEIQAIKEVVTQFKNLSFKYAFIHLGYGHNFRLFSDDGKQSVARGLYVKLENESALLHFVPDSCLPLYIQLDNRSTFKDLYYLAKQIYWFSNLSHRSYLPAKKTVTIMYPSLMAKLTEELKQVVYNGPIKLDTPKGQTQIEYQSCEKNIPRRSKPKLRSNS